MGLRFYALMQIEFGMKVRIVRFWQLPAIAVDAAANITVQLLGSLAT